MKVRQILEKYRKHRKVVLGVWVVVVLWLGVTCRIQQFKCPKLTDMEIFMRSDQCAMLDFIECE